MNDKFEIEVHSEGVHVWMRNWKGGYGLAADFMTCMTPQEVGQEILELLVTAAHEVTFKEG